MESVSPLELALRQIEGARAYTTTLLEATPADFWFQIPPGGATHIAWQVGHLAFAEYGLCLVRIRGREATDDAFLPPAFRRRFSKKSDPAAVTATDFSLDEVRRVFDGVHRQVLTELPGVSLEALDEEVPLPYLVFPNKLGALLFSSHHEMLHAGQIGLTRRLLGLDPVR